MATFIGTKWKEKDMQQLNELEEALRRINPNIHSRSAAIKQAVKIALHHIKADPIYQQIGKTEGSEQKNSTLQKRPITQIKSSDVDIYGKKIPKKQPSL